MCTIARKGHIKIRMHNGVAQTLCNVRHVPKLRKNMISLFSCIMLVLRLCYVWRIYRSKQADVRTEWSGATTSVLLREHLFDKLGVQGNTLMV